MTSITMLGPGSSVPQWAESLELEEFSSTWGTLGALEVMWLMENRAFARWHVIPKIGEAELLRIAVTPGHRRRGTARQLLKECIQYLTEHGCHALRLEVRVSNHPAQNLYLSTGWHQAGVRKAYYSNGEDAVQYVMPGDNRADFSTPPLQEI